MREWRDVPGWPYAVSDDGLVKRIEASPGTRAGKILKPLNSSHGYLVVTLSMNGKRQTFTINNLMCRAFFGPPPAEKNLAAHWDGDKHHNVLTNLRWASPQDNMDDCRRHGRQRARGELNPAAKLSDRAVIEIREAWSQGIGRIAWGQKQHLKQKLANRFGVGIGGIEKVVYQIRRTAS